MENETINRTIHEKVLNKCWHDSDMGPSVLKESCKKCGSLLHGNWNAESLRPDYTDDKNLHFVREAERKVVEKYGRGKYAFALLRQMDMAGNSMPEGDAVGTFQLQHVSDIALAPARTRCEAIIALLEEMEAVGGE
jgi:hypothetical protein